MDDFCVVPFCNNPASHDISFLDNDGTEDWAVCGDHLEFVAAVSYDIENLEAAW